jgi:hypothetical protein
VKEEAEGVHYSYRRWNSAPDPPTGWRETLAQQTAGLQIAARATRCPHLRQSHGTNGSSSAQAAAEGEQHGGQGAGSTQQEAGYA